MKNTLLKNIYSLEGKIIKRIVWNNSNEPMGIITSDDSIVILNGEEDYNKFNEREGGCIEIFDQYDADHLDKKTQYKFGLISITEYMKYKKEQKAKEEEKKKKDEETIEQKELQQLEYLANKYNKKIE